ncbi:MAG: YceI family protein [Phycisphaerales bacterium]
MRQLALVASGLVFAAGGLAVLSGMGSASEVATTSAAQADGFKIDAVHSFVFFKIQHKGVAYSGGRFNDISGTFNLDAAKPEASTVNITLKVDSIDTANGKRDQHLKSGDFFSAKEFPQITFTSTAVKAGSEPGTFEVGGDLTMRGTTKPISIKVKETGRTADNAGVWAEFTVKRSDFGVNFMVGKGLGDEVSLQVSLEGGK